jgi:glutamate racemase
MNPQLPIGIFDSGIGGLTVVRQIHKALPQEDLIYLGDTARVPYGTKSPSTVVRFACEDTQFLLQQHVKAVVVACNTCSAWALPMLEKKYSVPIFGVIAPGAQAALEKSKTRRIGVIGTNATIRSRSYTTAILAQAEKAKVFARATPLLVSLVEEGWVNHPVTQMILREYLTPLLRQKIDSLILGCTHYPLLKRAIRKVTGPRIQLIDSAEACGNDVARQLEKLGLLHPKSGRTGVIQPFVTDETERFGALAERFLGLVTEPAYKVELAPA